MLKKYSKTILFVFLAATMWFCLSGCGDGQTDTYVVAYNGGLYGVGVVAPGTKHKCVDFTLSLQTFSRYGEYIQTGWSLLDGGAKSYELGGAYTDDADVVLFPYWEQASSGNYFKTKTEIEAALTNYSIEIESVSPASMGGKDFFYFKKCTNGLLLGYKNMPYAIEVTEGHDFIIGDTAHHVRVTYNEYYTDNLVFDYTQIYKNTFDRYFFFYEKDPFSAHSYKNDAIKTGIATIAGRNCNQYTSEKKVSGILIDKLVFYIDTESGLCLKHEFYVGNKLEESMEVKEFMVGGVTVDNLFDLSGYTNTTNR